MTPYLEACFGGGGRIGLIVTETSESIRRESDWGVRLRARTALLTLVVGEEVPVNRCRISQNLSPAGVRSDRRLMHAIKEKVVVITAASSGIGEAT
jgi:hypothetical protein